MCLITDTGQFLLITQYQPLEAVAGCLRYDIAGRIALHRQARLPVPGMVGRTGGKFTEAVRRDRQAHRRFRNPRHQQPPPHV